jgi:hypothetical protein
MSNMIAPEMYRAMSPPDLGYVFVPDDDTFVKSDHFLEISFIQFGPERPVSATAWISRHTDDEPRALPFEPVNFGGEQTDKWIALLPPLEDKGTRWFYYITIKTSTGRQIEIWKDMNWFERMFSGFSSDKQLFWTTYEGNIVREIAPGKVMLVTHIVLSMGALLFMFHALYYLLWIFADKGRTHFIKAYRSVFWGCMTFFIGAIVLGIPITWYTFAVGFMPWPTQGLGNLGDVTDTKSVALTIVWAILLIGYMKPFKQAIAEKLEAKVMKKFAIWTLITLLFTVFVFLIPHSQFMQDT